MGSYVIAAMKLVIISDTHGRHENLGILRGDILIHCGDFEQLFEQDNQAIRKIDAWFGRQEFKHILCIGGNHDLTLEKLVQTKKQPFENAIYLQDTEFVYEGVKFYGAPWVPDLSNHAFYANDLALDQAWAKVPRDVDVLVTHTPPANILDVSSKGQRLGCASLSRRLQALNPGVHCFGHVHASAGTCVKRGTRYVNASYQPSTSAFEYEFVSRSGKSDPKSWWQKIRKLGAKQTSLSRATT